MDVQLIDTQSGGEITIQGGQPKIDNGLNTAVYISLNTNDNWWGGNQGGRIYQIKKNGQEQRQLLREYIKEALNWMIEKGLAESITVTLQNILSNTVFYDIIIAQPKTQPDVIYRFSLNWGNQAVSVERINNGY